MATKKVVSWGLNMALAGQFMDPVHSRSMVNRGVCHGGTHGNIVSRGMYYGTVNAPMVWVMVHPMALARAAV